MFPKKIIEFPLNLLINDFPNCFVDSYIIFHIIPFQRKNKQNLWKINVNSKINFPVTYSLKIFFNSSFSSE